MTRKFLILLASSLLTFAASAQDDIERDDESEDETEIRENPVIMASTMISTSLFLHL